MLSFADANRKTAWTKFCDALVEVMNAMDVTAKECKTLEAKNESLVNSADDMKRQVRDLLTLNDRLNAQHKEHLSRIKDLDAELLILKANSDVSKRVIQKAEKELAVERQKSVKPSAAASQSMDVDPSSVGGDSYVEVADMGGEDVGGADVGSASSHPRRPYHKQSVSVLDESKLRQRLTDLKAENDRLSGVIRSLTVYDTITADPFRGRVSTEEANKERRERIKLMGQLSSVSKEVQSMVQKHAEALEAKEAEFEKERSYWTAMSIEHKHECTRLKQEANKQTSTGGTSGLVFRCPQIFLQQDGMPMYCPVPIRTGHLMQLRDIYFQWRVFPSDNEGTFYASFLCPVTGRNTSLSSIDSVSIVTNIAAGLHLDVTTTPLIFQFYHNGLWYPFSFTDQIVIASMCCKLHRSGATDGMETVLVCRGQYNISIVVNKKIADLQMQPVHDSSQTVLARLLDSMPNFFQSWTFINHPDMVAVDENGAVVT